MKQCVDTAAPGEVFRFDPKAFSQTMPLNRADRRAWEKKARKAMKQAPGKTMDLSEARRLGIVRS